MAPPISARSGSSLGKSDLTADPALRLQQRDPVAALGRDGRRLEPRGPAADDEDVPRDRRGGMSFAPRVAHPRELALPPALGELDA